MFVYRDKEGFLLVDCIPKGAIINLAHAAIDIREVTGQEVIKKFWKCCTILDGIKTI
jgi:hypothetical protein